jgi:hypothetical protein
MSRAADKARVCLFTLIRLRGQKLSVPEIAKAMKLTPEQVEPALLRAEDILAAKPWLKQALASPKPVRPCVIKHINRFCPEPDGDLTARLMGDPDPSRSALGRASKTAI